MIDLRSLQQKHANTAEVYGYDGVPIFATTGIHEKAFEIFKSEKVDTNEDILVLGAGAGAFDKRLLSHGYKNVTSVEFVEGVHRVSGVRLLHNDLNKDFSDIGKFKAIIALEIIEHLENQFHFMRNISNMLKDSQSFAVVSTPNVESSFSRIKYALAGRLQWFGQLELDGTGHITPIFDHIFRFNISQAGMKVDKKVYNKNIWPGLLVYKNLLIRAAYFICYLSSFFILLKDNGEINLYLIKKI